MKFLQAVRLDSSDAALYKREGAAEEGEWLVAGGHAVCDIASGEHFFPQCRCASSFVGLAQWPPLHNRRDRGHRLGNAGRAHRNAGAIFSRSLGAPSREAALRVAKEEVRYTADLCETFSPEIWITVARTLNDTGDAVQEHYRAYDRLMIGTHKL